MNPHPMLKHHVTGAIERGEKSAITEVRPLSAIALDIRKHWPNVNYAAKPYLDAMRQMDSINDKFYNDDAKSMVLYFLSNAQTWRGADAKRIKAELKKLVGVK